ncbi:MAG: hypothetical protein ACOWWH_07320 [Eubacteriaceae bacterium]
MTKLLIILGITMVIDLREKINKKYIKEIIVYFFLVIIIMGIAIYISDPNFKSFTELLMGILKAKE